MTITVTHYVADADGEAYEYRQVNARLERRPSVSRFWQPVTGENFLRMTPAELRHIADVLEFRPSPSVGDQQGQAP